MLLEVCVEDIAGLQAAVAGGADRVELCAALALGGLTPPKSLVGAASESGLPVHLLARPREGSFCYSAAEAALVAEDIALAAEAGLAGVVIGASTSERELDVAMLGGWVAHAQALGVSRGRTLSLTLHRAFDLCPDLLVSLETAVELGFDRILTSGGASRAIDAVETLGILHRRAAGRITILAGSGIDAGNVSAIKEVGIREIHASCREQVAPENPEEMRLGFASGPRRSATSHAVAALRAVMGQCETKL